MSKTGVLLVIAAAVIGIYDAYAYLSGGEATTVSVWLRNCSMYNPCMFGAVCYLAGHIFSGMKCPPCLECAKRKNNGN